MLDVFLLCRQIGELGPTRPTIKTRFKREADILMAPSSAPVYPGLIKGA